MPHSRRRALAATRAHYTGETHAQAAAALGRHSHGVDECCPEQRALRAEFAVRVLNRSGGLSALLRYSLVVSPRWDCMVFYADIAEHICQRFLGSDLAWDVDLPEALPSTIELHHRRTGGSFRIVSTERPVHPQYMRHVLEPGIRPIPHHDLPIVASSDAQVLLGALVARLGLSPGRPQGHSMRAWELSWLHDPACVNSTYGYSSQLVGEGHRWTYLWSADPMLETVVTALTHPTIGVDGVTLSAPARRPDGHVAATLTYGAATLHLAHDRREPVLPTPLPDLLEGPLAPARLGTGRRGPTLD